MAAGAFPVLFFEPGSCYCFYREETEAAIYRELEKMNGNEYRVFTRIPHPRKLCKDYKLEPKSITWLSSENAEGYDTLHPSDMPNLNMRVCEGAKLKDGLKHIHFGRNAPNSIITNNGYDSFERFLSVLKDRAVVNGCIITADLDPLCFDTQKYSSLKKSCDFTELDYVEKNGQNGNGEKLRSLNKKG